MLRETLQSLSAQTDAPPFAVVIVDNDPLESAGYELALTFFASGALRGICVIEEKPGNCQACNRAFREALSHYPDAEFLMMIDDDEIADAFWVNRMIAAARLHAADIVGGPVLPRFVDGVPERRRRHPAYWPAYSQSGRVEMIYGSGNFLIRRRAFEGLAQPAFDLRYNFLGGGDTEFFTRCRRAGLSFYWEQEARIEEIVPAERIRLGWLFARGLRIGAINHQIDRTTNRTSLGAFGLFAKTSALLPVSAWRALRLALRGESFAVAVHPLMIALGRVFAAFGVEPQPYRLRRARK